MLAGDVEPLEGRRTVFAVRRPDGSQAVVKWSSRPRMVLDEWSALDLVGEADAPRLLGGNVDPAVLVMERLAPGPSLATLLLGTDGDAARQGLVAFARAVGRLNAATLGRARDFEVRRARLGPSPTMRHYVTRRLPRLLRHVERCIDDLGLVPPAGLASDVERVRAAMATPGPFLAVVHGDACPDNSRIYGDRAVLIDFQFAGVGHCLIDGAYFALPFPSCWCAGAWEPLDAGAALAAYRHELSRALPAVTHDEVWLPALAEASACWFLDWALEEVRPAVDADKAWGTVSKGQRLVQWAALFADLARRAGVLPALADLADQVAGLLRRRVADMPAYPALARPGQAVVARPDWWVPAP